MPLTVIGFDAADATFLRGGPVEEDMADVIAWLLKLGDQAGGLKSVRNSAR
jgi:hypothetical protein